MVTSNWGDTPSDWDGCPKLTSECYQLEFLKCTNLYAGKWLFKKFEVQSCILFKLFDPNFGEDQMVQWRGRSKDAKAMRSKKSKDIKKLIVAYLRSIEL